MLESLLLQQSEELVNKSPEYFFGYMGIAFALVFANIGAAYGTAKSGVGICSMGVLKPELIIKSVIPVIMVGILGLYGLLVALNNSYIYKMPFFSSFFLVSVVKTLL